MSHAPTLAVLRPHKKCQLQFHPRMTRTLPLAFALLLGCGRGAVDMGEPQALSRDPALLAVEASPSLVTRRIPDIQLEPTPPELTELQGAPPTMFNPQPGPTSI